MRMRFAMLSAGVLLAVCGCGHTSPSRSVVAKSQPGKDLPNAGKIQQVDYDGIDSKKAVVIEADNDEPKNSGWSLGNLNPFSKKKERIPLPLSSAETEDKSERSSVGF